jgi:hypothetical protein
VRHSFYPFNKFEWKEAYEIFGSNTFTDGAFVEATTNSVPIGFGEKCLVDQLEYNLNDRSGQTAVLDPQAVIAPATGPVTGGTLTLDNKLGPIHVGVNCALNGGKSSPCYVSEKQVINGKVQLTPTVTIMTWFDQKLTTGSMFSHSASLVTEVDMSTVKTKTVTWLDAPDSINHAGVWSEGESLKYPMFYTAGGHFQVHRPHLYTPDHTKALIKRHTELFGLPAIRWIAKIIMTYTRAKDVYDTAEFLKTQIWPGTKTGEVKTDPTKLTVEAKVALEQPLLMKSWVAGSSDFDKVKNLFAAELSTFAVKPVSVQYTAI